MPQEGRARPRGALEREVLACLAAAGGPLSPGDVLAELGGGLAYTTVMTTLSRLHAPRSGLWRGNRRRGLTCWPRRCAGLRGCRCTGDGQSRCNPGSYKKR